MNKSFLYRFADGTEMEVSGMTNIMLAAFKARFGECVFNGFTDQLESLQLLRANSHSKGDGFKPGWHPGLNMEIRTNGQYQQILKEKGMVEIGNEKQKTAKMKKKSAFTEDIIKDAISKGAEISGREASALLAGEKMS